MQDNELETIEIHLLLEAIYQYYGFDFRDYAMASLRRRIWSTARAEGLRTISALQDRILHDPACLDRFLLNLSVHVTAMFRDPHFYLLFRDKVVPLLRTYPFIRIWHAGCSTGEEVYSMAILLREEGLYERCRIYATDISEIVLRQARTGIFPLDRLKDYTSGYLKSGGTRAFSEYYTAAYNNAIFDPKLKYNIVFSPHNLAQDSPFNEFNVILCRNVLIYFNKQLQERVHNLLYESLAIFGILGLGQQETIKFDPCEDNYAEIESGARLYRRIA
ncbi:MAG: CheR family methyltransferase [Roseiflexaceae bacterium]